MSRLSQCRCLRTVETVETIWGQMNLLTCTKKKKMYIDYNT